MIRVLHLAEIINDNDFIDNVLRRLDRDRFHASALVGLPARRVAACDLRESYDARVLHVPFRWSSYPKMLRALASAIRAEQPDIVHTHHFHESLVAAIAIGMLRRRPRLIVGHHYSDHIYLLARGMKRRVYLMLEAFRNRKATKIVVPSEHVRRLLVDEQKVPRDRVRVIPYGLTLERYRVSDPEAPRRLRRSLGLDSQYLVLSCCRLSPEKGLEHALEAIASLASEGRDARYVVLGEGPHEATLQAKVRALGLARSVRFLGWRNDAIDWMAAADVIVQPSYAESFCQVLVEALAVGRPIIMTPVGAAPDVLGTTSELIVPKGDSRALAETIRRVMDDPHFAEELVRRGRRTLERLTDPSLAAARHASLYEEVLNERPSAATRT